MENLRFLDEAEKRKYKLKRWLVRPQAIAKAARDPEAWQGWKIIPKKDSVYNFLKKHSGGVTGLSWTSEKSSLDG